MNQQQQSQTTSGDQRDQRTASGAQSATQDQNTGPDRSAAGGRPAATSTAPSTDAARGTPGQMAQDGGEAAAANRQAPLPAADSQGSRAGSTLGSQAPGTGLADGEPQGSSQGLAGAQGSGGGAERGPAA